MKLVPDEFVKEPLLTMLTFTAWALTETLPVQIASEARVSALPPPVR